MTMPVSSGHFLGQSSRTFGLSGTTDRGAQLPAPLSSFVGREREIRAVVELLRQDGVRLVTLTGPGGVGKTRLALRAIGVLGPSFPDGIATVSLSPLRDSNLVLPAIAQAIAVRDLPERSIHSQLTESIRDRKLLLLLDNFEHLVEAGPEVAALLGACPGLKILVTSQVVLHLSGEHDIAVGPLPLPGVGPVAALDAVADGSAVQLFVQRAKAASSAFELTSDTVQSVVEVCRRLDGLPLAIELAAARVTHLSLAALLARLEHSLPLLTGGARDQPARQQTMRQAIAWSYDLLTPDEQALLRRLSVFAGGFTLAAAEAIAGDRQTDILDTIASLTDKSLLRIENRRDGETRYLMLETVRQFGAELLEAEGEADAVRADHSAFFAALAEAVAPGFDGARTIEQRSVLRADQDNFRAALDWFNQRGDAEGLLLLTRPLCIFWGNFGPWTEGSAWIERALTIEQPPSLIQAEILVHLGATAGYQGNFEQGTRWLNQARDVAVELGAPNIESFAITVLGAQQVDQGLYAEGETLVTEALTKATLSGDPYAEALACAHLGVAVWGQGRVAEAESLLERARVGQSHESHLPVEIACRYLGLIAAEADDPQRAAERFRQSSDYDSFEEHKLTRALPNLATLAVACGLPELATRLLGATDTISRITRFVPAWPERGAHDRALSRARETLGESAAATAFSAGQEMTSAEIQIAIKAVFAAAEAPAPLVAREQADSASQLTLREREVLRLIADGLTNTEIGDRLFISHRTAQTHVTNILAKLGVSTRTEAAARAIRDGLF